MRELAAGETTYQGKVNKMLEYLKKKYENNYKVKKGIKNLEPLYDIHDFWDS